MIFFEHDIKTKPYFMFKIKKFEPDFKIISKQQTASDINCVMPHSCHTGWMVMTVSSHKIIEIAYGALKENLFSAFLILLWDKSDQITK